MSFVINGLSAAAVTKFFAIKFDIDIDARGPTQSCSDIKS